MAVTNCRRSTAEKFLRENRWSLDYALDALYSLDNRFVEHQTTYEEELITTFLQYANDRCTIDSDSLIRYVGDLGYQLEDPVTICLAHLLQVENLTAELDQEQFMSTWEEVQCKNLEDMKHYMQILDNRLHDDPVYFQTIYSYTFYLALDSNERHLNIATAIAYWKLLFSSNVYAQTIPTARLESWFRFLREQSDYASLSKDVWDMFLRFANKFPDDETLLVEYNEMDAWPLMIDEYWEWLYHVHHNI